MNNRTRIPQFRLSPETFVSIVAAGTILTLLVGLIRLVYFEIPYNEDISWPAREVDQIFGIHSFSDFLQPFRWATLSNPWLNRPEDLVQYPPVAVLILKPLSLFPYRIAAIAYLALMGLGAICGVSLLTRKLPIHMRILVATVFGVASVPFIMAFDRGNLVGFFVLLYALFMRGVLQGNRKMSIIALVILASLKIYPLALILVFIQKRWFKESAYVVAAFAGILIYAFATYDGSFIGTIQGWLQANFGALSAHSELHVVSIQKVIVAVGFPSEKSEHYANLVWAAWNLVRLFLAVVIGAALVIRRIPNDAHVLFLGLTLTTFTYSAQLGYNWVWLPTFGALAVNELVNRDITNMFLPPRGGYFWVAVAFMAALISIPFGIHLPGSSTPITAWLSSIMAGVIAIWLLILSFRPRIKTELSW